LTETCQGHADYFFSRACIWPSRTLGQCEHAGPQRYLEPYLGR